jgi:hypothetical protein
MQADSRSSHNEQRNGLEFVDGLCGLGEGVGDGLVAVHVGAECSQFPDARIAKDSCGGHACQGEQRRLSQTGFGGALDARGSIRPSGSSAPAIMPRMRPIRRSPPH